MPRRSRHRRLSRRRPARRDAPPAAPRPRRLARVQRALRESAFTRRSQTLGGILTIWGVGVKASPDLDPKSPRATKPRCPHARNGLDIGAHPRPPPRRATGPRRATRRPRGPRRATRRTISTRRATPRTIGRRHARRHAVAARRGVALTCSTAILGATVFGAVAAAADDVGTPVATRPSTDLAAAAYAERSSRSLTRSTTGPP